MNLQENYKRLFKGKPMSNDISLVTEALAKVVSHGINGFDELVFNVEANGKKFFVVTGKPSDDWQYFQRTDDPNTPNKKVTSTALGPNIVAIIEKYVRDNESEIDMDSYTGKKASASSGISIPGINIKDFRDAVETIADGAGDGSDMTDDIVDELGDFYDGVYDSNNQKLIDAYDDLRSTSDGEPNDQAEAANKLLDVIG